MRIKKRGIRTKTADYLKLSHEINSKVNNNIITEIKKRKTFMKDIINEVNNQRFKNQEEWVDKFWELKDEINSHRRRILALRKAIRKSKNKETK